jgi:RNA-directed DNA polymerase
MKRIRNLYNSICAMDNIYLAHKKAKKGKRHYAAVKHIDSNPDQYLTDLWRMLIDEQYQTSPYSVITRKVGGKTRVIFKLPYYPDRIVHHCIMNILEPIWQKILVRDTYSAIKDRGVHDGVKRIKHFLKDATGTRYCLKIDVKKFYPSIDHGILKRIIRKKIKCHKTLALLDEIIDSAPGVPIGNYLSQYFGNLYLSYFDHFCKEVIGVKYYARYCDDIVVFSAEKAFLHKALGSIQEYLFCQLGLTLNGNYQIFPTRVRGVDFLGYRFFGDYTLVRKSIAKAFKRKMKISGAQTGKTTSSVMSYKGWLGHADANRLWKAYAPEWTSGAAG